jgi:hypothetical protein
MKGKLLVGLLSVEALACVLFCILQTSFTGVFSAAMAFPFEQLGMGLRSLSLSGGFGNGAAVVVYVAVSLLPIATLLILQNKRKLCAEDGLLGLLSAVLFAVLYLMINPSDISTWAGGMVAQSVGKAILGGMVYAVLSGYIILRVLRLFSDGGTEKLVRYMSAMLILLNALFVYLVFGACVNGLLHSIAALQAGNIGNEHLLGASYVFLVLQFMIDVLPYVFDLLVVFAALHLLDEMRSDRYSAETVAAAGRVSRLCSAALATTVLVNIGFNLLQILFAKSLVVINGSVQIPVFSITFVLAALLFTRLVAENKQLKDDNDLFV